MDFRSVLDVGSSEDHANIFRFAKKEVTTLNLYHADIIGDYCITEVKPTDCIWASHVLEHQPNPGLFLQKCLYDLKPNGILAVTVPPLKNDIVGGHLTLWNAGLLLYNLVMAGFDCSEASIKTYGYNISVIVRKKLFTLPKLNMDFGDIEKLTEFFPIPITHGFDGRIDEVNW